MARGAKETSIPASALRSLALLISVLKLFGVYSVRLCGVTCGHGESNFLLAELFVRVNLWAMITLGTDRGMHIDDVVHAKNYVI